MTVIANEPESEIVINYTKDAIIVSPNIVSFEIANALTKMMKEKVIDTKKNNNPNKKFSKDTNKNNRG
jgi:hypothetical protein